MNREILRLSLPNIISNISIPLLSTVDTALMGRLSPLHIGAVGVASMIFNFLYWNFGFLRMGTTGITAQAFGQNNLQEIVATLGRAILISLLIALVIIVFQNPLINFGIKLMNVPLEQQPLVESYFYIRVWAAPAALLMYSLLGWFFGLQNAIYPLIITITINIINIVLSYFFIIKLQWDIAGVAWSTVIAQYAGLLLCFGLAIKKYSSSISELSMSGILIMSKLTAFLHINSNIFIRTVCLTFSFGYFYSQSAKFGTELLAVNVILLQFLNWMSYAIDGFAYAAESIVGKYAGKGDRIALKEAINKSFIWGGILSLLFALTYNLFGSEILAIFSNDPSVLSLARPYLVWMWIIPVIAFLSYIWDGIYVGLTASIAMRNSMLIALIIYLGYYSLIEQSVHQLWFALTLFLLSRGIIQTILYWRKGINLN